jgi:hypothetical protein
MGFVLRWALLVILLTLFLHNMGNATDQFTGVDPKGVAYTESRGMNWFNKLWPGKNGEIGTYQLTPIAFRDLQRLDPKYKNANQFLTQAVDPWAKDAMEAYMRQLHENYNVPDNARELTQAYNVGPTAYKRGVRNPKYFKTYQEGVSSGSN